MVVPLSAFLIFISLLCVKALRASRSAGGRLFLGFASFKSAISGFIEYLTLGITLVQSKPAKVQTENYCISETDMLRG